LNVHYFIQLVIRLFIDLFPPLEAVLQSYSEIRPVLGIAGYVNNVDYVRK